MGEEFRDIVGYEGLYLISSFGRVLNIKTRKRKFLKEELRQDGCKAVKLYKNGIMKTNLVHRLVATAFIPNPKNSLKVIHKDGDNTNNQLSNLEWYNKIEKRINNIENDYVNFEANLLLRERGFAVPYTKKPSHSLVNKWIHLNYGIWIITDFNYKGFQSVAYKYDKEKQTNEIIFSSFYNATSEGAFNQTLVYILHNFK